MNKKVNKMYVIHAMDKIFQGLHGMEEWTIENCSIGDAEEIGEEMSLDIIESYSAIYDILTVDIEDFIAEHDEKAFYPLSAEEKDELRYEVYHEDIEYEIYLIDDDKIKNLKEEDLEKLLERDPRDFIEKYCELL